MLNNIILKNYLFILKKFYKTSIDNLTKLTIQMRDPHFN